MATVAKPRKNGRKASESRLLVAHDPERGTRISSMDPDLYGRGKTYWCTGCLRHGKKTELEFRPGKPVPHFRKKSGTVHHASCPYKNLQRFANRTAEEEFRLSSPDDNPSEPDVSISRTLRPDPAKTRYMQWIRKLFSEVEVHSLRSRLHLNSFADEAFSPDADHIGYVFDAPAMRGESGKPVLLVGKVENIVYSGDWYKVRLSSGDARRSGVSCQLCIPRWLYADRTVSMLHGHWVAVRGRLVKRSDKHFRIMVMSFPEQLVPLHSSLREFPAPRVQLHVMKRKLHRAAGSLEWSLINGSLGPDRYGILAEEHKKQTASVLEEIEKEYRITDNQLAVLKREWRTHQERYRTLKHRQETLEKKLPRFLLGLLSKLFSFPGSHRFRTLHEWSLNSSKLEKLGRLIRHMHEKWLGLESKQRSLQERILCEKRVLEELMKLAEREAAAKTYPDGSSLFSVPESPERIRIIGCRIRDDRHGTLRLEWTSRRFRLQEGWIVPDDDLDESCGTVRILPSDWLFDPDGCLKRALCHIHSSPRSVDQAVNL
ncbi:hypothetical protein [Staphylospora marina]|uniref:hypothetical protein n=1 Tax=Staphylospora marina TaxID=2490858 RepID=UPI000F5BEA0E|nr:hypothetical protein [Staphylospora marina]